MGDYQLATGDWRDHAAMEAARLRPQVAQS